MPVGWHQTAIRDCTVTGRFTHENIPDFTGGDLPGNGVPKAVKTFFGTDGMKYSIENCITQ